MGKVIVTRTTDGNITVLNSPDVTVALLDNAVRSDGGYYQTDTDWDANSAIIDTPEWRAQFGNGTINQVIDGQRVDPGPMVSENGVVFTVDHEDSGGIQWSTVRVDEALAEVAAINADYEDDDDDDEDGDEYFDADEAEVVEPRTVVTNW